MKKKGIKQWVIYKHISSKPYILDASGLEVSDDEIDMNISEQIFNNNSKTGNEGGKA